VYAATETHKRQVALLAGVCCGIAKYFGWRPAQVRLIWVFLTLFTAGVGGLIAYAALAFSMPDPPRGIRLEDFRVQ